MCDRIERIKASELFPVILDMMESGKSVKIAVTGSSMLPFLQEGTDGVSLLKADYAELKRGSIVLFVRQDGTYVLHRIVKKTGEHFFMAGDAQQWVEGPVLPAQIIAAVEAVWKGERRVSCKCALWRCLSWIWIVALPIRCRLLGVGRRIVMMCGKIGIRNRKLKTAHP